jgi:hypothetical protein
MLVHDVSDVPLDLVRVFMLLKWDIATVSWTILRWCAVNSRALC